MQMSKIKFLLNLTFIGKLPFLPPSIVPSLPQAARVQWVMVVQCTHSPTLLGGSGVQMMGVTPMKMEAVHFDLPDCKCTAL